MDTIDTGRPSFTKLAHDIKIYYNEDAQSWVINNEGENIAFAVSNAQSPSHISSGLVFTNPLVFDQQEIIRFEVL